MYSNMTESPSNVSFKDCFWYGTGKSHTSVYYAVALSASVIIAVLSPVAVIGNALIVAAIWKRPSLRTPSYIFLCGLALTDFCTGLVAQPLHTATILNCLERPQKVHDQHSYLAYVEDIAEGCGGYVTCLTLLLITLMSVERWLHITHPSLLTVRRTFYVLLVVSLLLVPAAVFISLFFLRKIHSKASNIIVIFVLLFFLITTSIAYFEVFRNICRQQKQIQTSKGRPQGRWVMKLCRYKKSVITILYILGAFYISVLPFFTFVVLYLWYSHSRLQLMFTVSLMFLFFSPSLNPVIYLWRMNDIRNAVKQLLRQLFCKSS